MADHLRWDHPLRKLFRRTLESAFRGFRDLYSPDVAAHLDEHILSDFLHSDRLYRLRTLPGRPIRELPEMLRVAREKEGPERRIEVDGYLGNFILFMGSLFPSALRRRRWTSSDPMVARVGSLVVRFSRPWDYYVAEGRRAYERAAETARIFDPGAEAVFGRLGSHMEGYVELLSAVKRMLPDDPLLRQGDGWIE